MKNNLKLIFDGAMGTYFNSLNRDTLIRCERANIKCPEQILQIHREYIEAGAMAIKTNTFAANTKTLETDISEVKEITKRAIDIAKEAVENTDVEIFATIGPILVNKEDALREYKIIVDIFLEHGIVNFLFETFAKSEGLIEITQYIKEKNPHAYIIVSFGINPHGETKEGFIGENLLKDLDSVQTIDALGFNCVLGSLHMKKYLETMEYPKKPMSIMPNSGYPTVEENRTFFHNDPDYYAVQMAEIVQMGATFVGGCCGTTPQYIRKTVEVLSNLEDINLDIRPSQKVTVEKKEGENKLLKAIEEGKKPIAVEYDPPEDMDMDKYMNGVRYLKAVGVDAITIADCPVARARVDSSLTGYKIKHETGIDPVVHLTCRDRNLNATKALLMGLNIEDILNVIVITGDPIPTVQRDEIKSVFNFNSVRLAGFVERLNREVFPKRMNIGAALNLNAINFDAELKKAVLKEENGVNIFYTQPVLSDKAIENLKLARNTLSAYIMGGIIPVVSYRNARFMNSEISGITVSEDIMESYKDKEREEAHKMALDYSVDFMEKIYDYIDGYYLITPFNNVKLIGKIINSFQEKHR